MRHKRAQFELYPKHLGGSRPGKSASRRQRPDDKRQHATIVPHEDHVPVTCGRTDSRTTAFRVTPCYRFNVRRVRRSFLMDMDNVHAHLPDVVDLSTSVLLYHVNPPADTV